MSATPESWEEIKRLFEGVLELEPSKRSLYLQENAHDSAVRAEVERLVAEYDEAGNFLPTHNVSEVATETLTGVKLSAGETIAGRFKIVRFIAAGGMGEVYEADDLELRERVAIKTIPKRLLQPRAISGFRREVQLARRVTHRNVCRVFDLFRGSVGDNQGQDLLFVSMELLHGATLYSRLGASGAFSLPEAAPLLRQLAAGLSAAHKVGVIHGDLKPGNIFLEDQKRPDDAIRAVITDFGLAVPALDYTISSLATLSTLGTEGRVCGTPAYMAPEQLQGRRATVASDVYAFGLIVYEMITDTRAFDEHNVPLLMNAVLTKKPRTPSSLKTNLPANFDTVVLKALEKDPAHRYQSVDQFMEVLEAQVIHAAGDPELGLSQSQSLRKQPLGIVMFLVLLLASISGYSYHMLSTAKQLHNKLTRTSLTFSIVAQEYVDGKTRGEPYRVTDQEPFHAGMGIHFVVSSPEPGYLYILGEAPGSTELAPLINVIFPSPFTNGGSARLEPGQDLTVPANGPLVFDNHKGTETVWLVWSTQSPKELESLKRWANQHDRGRISDPAAAFRIKSFLDSSALSLPKIGKDSVNRTSLVASGNTLVYPLHLNHI